MAHENLNGIYCDLVYELLSRFNVDGYYFLEDLINGTKHGKIMRRIMQAERDNDILELIEANDKGNRTVLAEKLSKSGHSNTCIATIEIHLNHNLMMILSIGYISISNQKNIKTRIYCKWHYRKTRDIKSST